ncbi:MAG: hypothetical protein AAF560_24475 [Acidobacteriota bacterium]
MSDPKNLSLAELKALYEERHAHWTRKHHEILQAAEESRRKAEQYQQKLRYVQALQDGIELPIEPARPRRRRRRRHSLYRDAVLKVLNDRPGHQLSEAQILDAVRNETGRSCSRQTINNNVYVLEQDGLIQRERAPRGSGSQFVFSAIPGARDPEEGG